MPRRPRRSRRFRHEHGGHEALTRRRPRRSRRFRHDEHGATKFLCHEGHDDHEGFATTSTEATKLLRHEDHEDHEGFMVKKSPHNDCLRDLRVLRGYSSCASWLRFYAAKTTTITKVSPRRAQRFYAKKSPMIRKIAFVIFVPFVADSSCSSWPNSSCPSWLIFRVLRR